MFAAPARTASNVSMRATLPRTALAFRPVSDSGGAGDSIVDQLGQTADTRLYEHCVFDPWQDFEIDVIGKCCPVARRIFCVHSRLPRVEDDESAPRICGGSVRSERALEALGD